MRGLVLTYPRNCHRGGVERFLVNSFECKKRSWLCQCPKSSWKCCEGRISEEKPQNVEQPKTKNPARSLEVRPQCWRMTELRCAGTRRFKGCEFTLFQSTVSCAAGSWGKGSKQFAFIPSQSIHWSFTSSLWVAVRQKWNSWCEFSPALWTSVRELLLSKGLAVVPARLTTLQSGGAGASSSPSPALTTAPFRSYVHTALTSTGSHWRII